MFPKLLQFGGSISICALTYSIVPNIWIFAFAEFLFAMGAAFVSGALEAWMYDISKKLKIEDRFREISVTNNNLAMLGMITAALIFIPLSKVLPVQQIFRFKIVQWLVKKIAAQKQRFSLLGQSEGV